MGPYGEQSRRYRKLGWQGTLPLPPGQKHPPPTHYTGSGRPHPTDTEVTQWIKTKGDGNLALRLAEVSPRVLKSRMDLPAIYAGNNVDGWELLGIDIDNYGDKHGYDEYRKLEKELGVLPKTAVSTARPGIGSGTPIYLVPKGFRFMGKADLSIDIIQKRHRFTVVWPSTNPDTRPAGAQYVWYYGQPKDLIAKMPGPLWEGFENNIPNVATDDIVVLPEKWFNHLSRQGTLESDDAISNMTDDQLSDWLSELRYEDDPCDYMKRVVAKWIGRLDETASSHDQLTGAHWEMLNCAAEGHAGIAWALSKYHPKWYDHVQANSGRMPEDAQAEISRSIVGALDKIQPFYNGLGRPDDTCGSAYGNAEDWAARYEANEGKAIADTDFDGFGPIVGKMEVLGAKPADEYGQHDTGNGRHFVDLYGGNVKYVDGRDGWVVWDGKRWHRDINGRNVGLAYGRVRLNQETFAYKLLREGKDADDKDMMAKGKSWLKWAQRSGNDGPIKFALNRAIGMHVLNPQEPVAVHANIFDSNPGLLGCENGVLELTNDPDLREPRKEDFVTFNTNVPYISWRSLANSDGETFEGYELWLEYLNLFLPNKELQMYVQKVMGYLIVGENPDKRFVFLYGPHDTGKSTMMGAIKSALGDYYGTVDVGLFRPRDLNPGLIRACPLRVTAMSEVDAGTMDAATVKRLTGNDFVQAEAKYSNDIFEGRPQFTTIVAANNPPNIRHADEALEERLLVLPFTKTVDRTDRKYERQNQIEDHSGIAVLSWLVEGWKMYCADGLGDPPNAVLKAQRSMVSGLNPTQGFISEMLEKASESEEGRRMLERASKHAKLKNRTRLVIGDYEPKWTPSAASVYEAYKRWANANGVDPVSHPELTKDMGLGKPEQRKLDGKNARCYIGVRIRQFEDQGGAGWRVK